MERTGQGTRALTQTGKWALLVIGCLVVLIPFWLLGISSLRQSTVLLEYPPRFWPERATLANYIALFDPERYDFIAWFVNSVIVAGASTLGTVLVCSLAGYAFAKKSFPGKRVIFAVALGTMMIPSAVTLIPLFLIVKGLGLINTLTGIIVPSLGAAFGVFLMRQFISTLPSSLLESAQMDGCRELGVYARIVVPMTTPALAVLSIFTFMNQWNSLVFPLIIADSENKKMLTVGIAGLKSMASSPWGLMMAASLLSFVPILIVFLFMRERFVAGLTAGAVKG